MQHLKAGLQRVGPEGQGEGHVLGGVGERGRPLVEPAAEHVRVDVPAQKHSFVGHPVTQAELKQYNS